jgi:hypothetical protein
MNAWLHALGDEPIERAQLKSEHPVSPRIGVFIHQARTCTFLGRPTPATAGKPFVHDEHVVAGIMQFDDSRVLHA